MIKLGGTHLNLFIDENDSDYKKIVELYGETKIIEPMFMPRRAIDLRRLKPNESVCAGDGKTWYCKLTKK